MGLYIQMQTMLYLVISTCLPTAQDLAYSGYVLETEKTDTKSKNVMHETNEREKQHTQTDTNKIHTNKVERQQGRNRKLEKRIKNYTLIGVKDNTEDIDICEIINQNSNTGISPYILTNRHLFKYGSNQKHVSQDIIKKFNVNHVPDDREVFYRDENPLTNTTNSKDLGKNTEKGKKQQKNCKETNPNCKRRHNRRRKIGKQNKKQKQVENNKYGKNQTDYDRIQRTIPDKMNLESIVRTLGLAPNLVELNEADSKRLQNVYDIHEFMTKLSNDEEHELSKLKNFTIEQVACPNSIEIKRILLNVIKIYELTIKTENETEEKKKETFKIIEKSKKELTHKLNNYENKLQSKSTKADKTEANNTDKDKGTKKAITKQESAHIRHNKKRKNRNRKQQTDIDASITTLGSDPDTWKTQKRTNQIISRQNDVITDNDNYIAPANNNHMLQKSVLNFLVGVGRFLGGNQLPSHIAEIQ